MAQGSYPSSVALHTYQLDALKERGNVAFKRGDLPAATKHYEKMLELQAPARHPKLLLPCAARSIRGFPSSPPCQPASRYCHRLTMPMR